MRCKNLCMNRSWVRDNTVATTLPCFQTTKLLIIIALCLDSLWLLNLNTETINFSLFYLSLKLIYVVAKFKNKFARPALHCNKFASTVTRKDDLCYHLDLISNNFFVLLFLLNLADFTVLYFVFKQKSYQTIITNCILLNL